MSDIKIIIPKRRQMKVNKEDIIRLRKTSGQPIMDCKKALLETNSFDEAFEYIRKNAKEKIDERRKDRITSEGRVVVKCSHEFPVYGSKIAMVSLLCETDFTAKSELFSSGTDKIAKLALSYTEEDRRQIEEIVDEVKTQTGEKVEVGQIFIHHVTENTSIGSYVHFDNKKAAIVQFEANSNPVMLQELGKNIAMHIVACKPQFLDDKEIDWSRVDLEIPEHLKNKPEEILAKISRGKREKFKKERVLINQIYCLDDKITVDQAIKNVRRDEMMEITLKKYRHIEIGI
jgi:elongation factor Ts